MSIGVGTPGFSIGEKSRYDDVFGVGNTLMYRLSEGTGTAIDDANDTGANGTASGSSGTYWDNATWWTPGGTDDKILIPTSDALDAICTMSNFSGKQLIVAMDFYYDGDQTGTETLITWGAPVSSHSGWGIRTNSSEVMSFIARGEGASASETKGITGTSLAGFVDTRVNILFDIRGATDTTIDITVYLNGSAVGTYAAFDVRKDGTDNPVDGTDKGLVIGANRTSGSAFGAYLGSTASNARVRDVLLHHRDIIKGDLGSKLAAEINNSPLDWYRRLTE